MESSFSLPPIGGGPFRPINARPNRFLNKNSPYPQDHEQAKDERPHSIEDRLESLERSNAKLQQDLRQLQLGSIPGNQPSPDPHHRHQQMSDSSSVQGLEKEYRYHASQIIDLQEKFSWLSNVITTMHNQRQNNQLEGKTEQKCAILFNELVRIGKKQEQEEAKLTSSLQDIYRRMETAQVNSHSSSSTNSQDTGQVSLLMKRVNEVDSDSAYIKDRLTEIDSILERESRGREEVHGVREKHISDLRAELARNEASLVDQLRCEMEGIRKGFTADRDEMLRKLNAQSNQSIDVDAQRTQSIMEGFKRMNDQMRSLESSFMKETSNSRSKMQENSKENEQRYQALVQELGKEVVSRSSIQTQIEDELRLRFGDLNDATKEVTADLQVNVSNLEEIVRAEVKGRMRNDERNSVKMEQLKQDVSRAIVQIRSEHKSNATTLSSQVRRILEAQHKLLHNVEEKLQQYKLSSSQQRRDWEEEWKLSIEALTIQIDKEQRERKDSITNLYEVLNQQKELLHESFESLQSALSSNVSELRDVIESNKSCAEDELSSAMQALGEMVDSWSKDFESTLQEFQADTARNFESALQVDQTHHDELSQYVSDTFESTNNSMLQSRSELENALGMAEDESRKRDVEIRAEFSESTRAVYDFLGRETAELKDSIAVNKKNSDEELECSIRSVNASISSWSMEFSDELGSLREETVENFKRVDLSANRNTTDLTLAIQTNCERIYHQTVFESCSTVLSGVISTICHNSQTENWSILERHVGALTDVVKQTENSVDKRLLHLTDKIQTTDGNLSQAVGSWSEKIEQEKQTLNSSLDEIRRTHASFVVDSTTEGLQVKHSVEELRCDIRLLSDVSAQERKEIDHSIEHIKLEVESWMDLATQDRHNIIVLTCLNEITNAVSFNCALETEIQSRHGDQTNSVSAVEDKLRELKVSTSQTMSGISSECKLLNSRISNVEDSNVTSSHAQELVATRIGDLERQYVESTKKSVAEHESVLSRVETLEKNDVESSKGQQDTNSALEQRAAQSEKRLEELEDKQRVERESLVERITKAEQLCEGKEKKSSDALSALDERVSQHERILGNETSSTGSVSERLLGVEGKSEEMSKGLSETKAMLSEKLGKLDASLEEKTNKLSSEYSSLETRVTKVEGSISSESPSGTIAGTAPEQPSNSEENVDQSGDTKS